jgi:hypothetical protein
MWCRLMTRHFADIHLLKIGYHKMRKGFCFMPTRTPIMLYVRLGYNQAFIPSPNLGEG